MIKSFLTSLFNRAMSHNRQNILDLVQGKSPAKFLDLGCDDGEWTLAVARASNAKTVSGIEVIEEQAAIAKSKSINVIVSDLGHKFPVENESFDLVHSNQVIEHVADVDFFTAEIFRVLKPGGLVVISTENGSSWHNIFAAILGWQIFSLTNMSGITSGIGNPMALHRNTTMKFKTWTHKVIFNYRGLIEFFEAHGFTDIQIKGAGYYPFPSIVGAWDPRHAHFITLSARKPR